LRWPGPAVLTCPVTRTGVFDAPLAARIPAGRLAGQQFAAGPDARQCTTQ
jgi:hypothetical protein